MLRARVLAAAAASTALAVALHREYTSKRQPVDVIGHSMGGLIARLALLGSAQGWAGFPSKFDVDNVVTLEEHRPMTH
jgi:alpha-beta hydrolase superfamily lysophospholipase